MISIISLRRRIDWIKTENSLLKLEFIHFFIFLFVSIVLCLSFNQAQAQQGGQRPAAYLGMGVGGAQEAMAGAAVAVRNDVACGFWNPAGLSGLRGLQVEDQYTLLSLNQQLNYLSMANGFRDMMFYGISWIYYSAGNDIEERKGPTFNPDSTFGDTEMTFLVSLAFRLNPRWSIGINLKTMIQDFSNQSAYGFGEDLGVQYRVTKNTTMGLMVEDPLTVFNSSNNVETYFPITLKAGIAHQLEKQTVKVNFDLEWSSDVGLRPRGGLEWRPMDVIALRGGCWLGDLTTGGTVSANFTGGVGILVPVNDSHIEFDYAILPDRIVPGAVLHQVSLTGQIL